MRKLLCLLLAGGLAWPSATGAGDADWPMWRGGPARHGSTPHALAETLHLQWTRQFAPPRPAWPPQPEDGDKLEFDRAPQPIIYRGTIYVASAADDSLTALDPADGSVRWRFQADGPLRLAPAAADGRVFVAADDGHLYCLDAADGRELWRFRGAPGTDRRLGNGRLISAWPARGGPVVENGTVYFAAGIFSFMGVFVHALRTDDGTVVWSNSGSGYEHLRQVHGAAGFAGPVPQGYLALDDERLFVAGGRSRPGVFCRETGTLLHFELSPRPAGSTPPEEDGALYGGYDIILGEDSFFLHGEMHLSADGRHVGWLGRDAATVHGRGGVFGVSDGQLLCHAPAALARAALDRRGRETTRYEARRRWAVPAPPGLRRVHLQAGERLYGATGCGRVLAIETAAEKRGKTSWSAQTAGTPWTMAAGGGRLLVMTEEGVLHAFGPAAVEAPPHHRPGTAEPAADDRHWAAAAAEILAAHGSGGGYALVAGLADGGLGLALLRGSDRHLIMIDADPGRTARVRRRLEEAGWYGSRAAVLTGTPSTLDLPPYFAELIVSERPAGAGFPEDPAFAARLFASLRPYGGRAWLPATTAADREALRAQLAAVEGARLEGGESVFTRLVRPGPLPGAGWWTHEHADAARTGLSADERVRAPLGLLWFGGPSNRHLFDRHYRGPGPQVVAGRVILAGPDSIQARDVYTGRKLWRAALPGFGRIFTAGQSGLGFSPSGNYLGTPLVSLPDGIYAAVGDRIVRLDPADGSRKGLFRAPADPETGQRPEWSSLAAWEDLLIATADDIFFDDRPPTVHNWNAVSSRRLVVLDRHRGEVLWQRRATAGFRHNAVAASGDGRLFVIDRLPGETRHKLARRGGAEPPARLLCLDARDGTVRWETDRDVFATWLGYAGELDILLEAGRHAIDRRVQLVGEPERLAARRGADGTRLWERDGVFRNAPLLEGENIIFSGRVLCLLSGADREHPHPLSGEKIPWRFSGPANCAEMIGNRNLLLFRRGAASYYDLSGRSGTGNLGGFRAGCIAGMIPADGVVSAPDMTRGCICSYQLQTSLALIPDDRVAGWTFGGAPAPAQPVRAGGINLGAPGDRLIGEVLWLGFPGRGSARALEIDLADNGASRRDFLAHPDTVVNGGPHRAVAASGSEGAFTLRLRPGGETPADTPRRYTVALHFLEPEDPPRRRVFDVRLQGDRVLADFEPAAAAGGPRRETVHEFKGITVSDFLEVTLAAADGSERPPLLNGLSFRLEP